MSIIKRKAGSEDLVKSILEFDEVPTEGSHNLVESGAVAQAIGNLGQPLQWKGPATVSELNTGITGIQPGWTYTLTDAGTLTDGSIVVDVGDEVAWTADGEWFKFGSENPENQKVNSQQIFNNLTSNPASLDDVAPNTITYLQRTANTTTTNFPSDFGTGLGVLVTDKAFFGDGGYQVFQFITKFRTKQVWRRVYTWLTSSGTGSWNAWEIFYDGGSKLFEIGPGKTYTTLRAGITAAYQVNGAKVVIYPGTYDLVTECSDILATTLTENFTPCPLGNDMHVFAHAGVYIKAIVEKTEEMTGTQFNSIKEHFEPFSYVAGNFIVENLNIESKNTRYCIHDDHSVTPYSVRHEYINCRMKRTTDNVTSSLNFVACIGGGLNKHSTVIVDGGYYESAPTTGIQSVESGDVNYAQQPISYHNINSEEADSSITLKNVYFADKGYLRVSDYGPSTTLSKVYASGCRFGYPIMHKYEVADLGHDNITIAADWNNDVANKGSWTIAADGYTATWTPAS